MLKKVLIALGVLLAVLLAIIATRPSTYRVERSTIIGAPPARVFPYANDFKRFVSWSPWQKLDPNIKTTFSGPPQGTGSVYEWQGNHDVGRGRMTIVESKPDAQVKYRLEFMEPFASTANTTVTFAPAGTGTLVMWAMEGTNNFAGKAMSLFMDMDKMIGKDFEAGLANMKGLAEDDAKKATP
jgi:uncharacterized protein YndB with AHSA1/START domain